MKLRYQAIIELEVPRVLGTGWGKSAMERAVVQAIAYGVKGYQGLPSMAHLNNAQVEEVYREPNPTS